jgi:hypothetical protein
MLRSPRWWFVRHGTNARLSRSRRMRRVASVEVCKYKGVSPLTQSLSEPGRPRRSDQKGSPTLGPPGSALVPCDGRGMLTERTGRWAPAGAIVHQSFREATSRLPEAHRVLETVWRDLRGGQHRRGAPPSYSPRSRRGPRPRSSGAPVSPRSASRNARR